jgi:hypothetical protein
MPKWPPSVEGGKLTRRAANPVAVLITGIAENTCLPEGSSIIRTDTHTSSAVARRMRSVCKTPFVTGSFHMVYISIAPLLLDSRLSMEDNLGPPQIIAINGGIAITKAAKPMMPSTILSQSCQPMPPLYIGAHSCQVYKSRLLYAGLIVTNACRSPCRTNIFFRHATEASSRITHP